MRHALAEYAQVHAHLRDGFSLRAVERYLHSLPGADAGAAGAIERVKATGTLSPVITPQLHPVGRLDRAPTSDPDRSACGRGSCGDE